MRLAIFPFSSISTTDLEGLARLVVPGGSLRERGRSEDRYRSYLAGRCAVKVLFSSINAPRLVTPNVEYGYLEVLAGVEKNAENVFVNVSHTDSVSVAALSTTPIGVDVESRARSAARVLVRVATERERAWVNNGKPFDATPAIGKDIFLWSAKEAASKSVGLGMKFGLQTFEIVPSESPKIFGVETKTAGPLKLSRPVICFEIWEDYFITICSEKSSVLRGVNGRIIGSSDIQSFRQKANR